MTKPVVRRLQGVGGHGGSCLLFDINAQAYPEDLNGGETVVLASDYERLREENAELRAALEEAVRYMGAVAPDVYHRTHAPILRPPIEPPVATSGQSYQAGLQARYFALSPEEQEREMERTAGLAPKSGESL